MFLRIARSKKWDQLYLGSFAMLLLLATYIYDNYASTYSNLGFITLPSAVLLLPPIAMLFSQLLPLFGMLYLITHCNDLVHDAAEKDFGDWAFVSVLLSQSIEKFWYGGLGKSHLAGKCGFTRNSLQKRLKTPQLDLEQQQQKHHHQHHEGGDDDDSHSDVDVDEEKLSPDNSTIASKVRFDDASIKPGSPAPPSGAPVASANDSVISGKSGRTRSSQENASLSTGRRKKIANATSEFMKESGDSSVAIDEATVTEWLEWKW